MPLETLSPSRAGDFKACPQLFRFRAIERLSEPVTTFQARGTAAHLALQRLYELSPELRTPEALFNLFRGVWGELRCAEEFEGLFASVEDEKVWGLESLHLLANYFMLERPEQVQPVERELDMLEPFDEEIVIRGILDRMDRGEDGRLVITDYKTGKAPPETYALPAFFALKIYALLIRRRFNETPSEVRLLYLNGPTMYRIPIEDRQLDAMERQLRALWKAINRAIEQNNFPPRPSRLCDYCSFRDRCPAWAAPSALAG